MKGYHKMKLILFAILILLLLIACSEPIYKMETEVNGYNDTIYTVNKLTTSWHPTDYYWYENVYSSHDKEDAKQVYDSLIKQWEEYLKRQYKSKE